MNLQVDIRHRLGDFKIDAKFQSSGRLTALFGRSGAGKSSVISVIGGQMQPDYGRVMVDGHVLLDTDAKISVPMHQRRVGYVFQDGRLFPHLNVRQNLLYGRFFSPSGGHYSSLSGVVELLGIEPLLERRPANLSGGEKQRVAIGRALLSSPRLLLMDEPLSALDEERKAEILPYIERLRDEVGIPIVYVSHAVAEVARLATTVVAMADGRVSAVGRPNAVLGRYDLTADADPGEAGTVLKATVACHDDEFSLTTLTAAGGELTVPRLQLSVGTPVRVRIRARDIMVATDKPQGLSALNVLPVAVQDISRPNGHAADVRLVAGDDVLTARLTRRSIKTLALAPGSHVYAVIKSIAFDDENLSAAPHYHDTADAHAALGG